MATTITSTSPTPASPAADDELRPSLRERLMPPLPTDTMWGWVGPLAITLLAAVLRLWRLDEPHFVMFDEEYYARDALRLWDHGAENSPQGTTEGFVVHPPVGKWMIGFGEALFHVTARQVKTETNGGVSGGEFGFRVAAAVVGVLSVLIICRLVRRMTRSTLLGCFAGLLLTLDGMHFVQSRIAMLDIFLLFWVLAAFACLVVDRDQMRERLARAVDAGADLTGAGPKLGIRWWRIAAGVCIGLSIGTKWSGLYWLAALLVLAIVWDWGARRAAGFTSPGRSVLRRESVAIALIFLVLPPVLYVASWTGWFASDVGWSRQWAQQNPGQSAPWVPGFVSDALPDAGVSWLHYQKEIYDFHSNLHTRHPYMSKPLSWMVLQRPVAYEYTTVEQGKAGCTSDGGCSREVLGIGTPMIWWASILALLAMVYLWAARRDWRAGATLLMFTAGVAPWLLQSDRTMFLFYALPVVPFMVIALALCAGLVLGGRDASESRRRWGAVVVGAYTLLVAANFFGLPGVPAFGLYPILSDQQIPFSDWDAKTWFTSWV